ncbi:MAG: TRAP transporter permease [Bacillota bacterium]
MQESFSDRLKTILTLRNLSFIISIFFFVYLVHYFLTGAGGPLELATRMVPVAIIIFVLNTLQTKNIYPRLGNFWNRVIGVIYIGVALFAMIYFWFEFENIFMYRAGSYNQLDFIVGLLMFLLIMEISRKIHTILFAVNMVLIVYSLYGYLSPVDFFWHPGVSFTRIVTSTTLELATGIYGRYAQMALTLVAAFLLLAAVAKAFGAQSAIISYIYGVFGRTKHNIPQVAVLSSASLGAVSGSGAANTAVTGSFTIPLMIKHGIHPVYAGAVETAASMGGLIMPPLMAVAGFIMADFLGVPYWDVVIRGFSLSFIYFSAVIMSVYLLSVSSVAQEEVDTPEVPIYNKLKTYSFFACIISLIIMMGVIGHGPMRAAVYTASLLAFLLLAIHLYYKYKARDENFRDQHLPSMIRDIIETHADMAWYLVILMSTLGIMIGLFTVTGFIMRMGALMMQLGAVSIFLTILVAWAFGWLAGTGLPPTATYIVVAVIVAPPFIAWGINPWVAHIFVFLVSVWGELSPPTSLTAAVASRLANASFMRTMMTALKICLPILVMSFAIFIRTDLVTTPGLPQIRDTILVTIGTLGFTFAMFGRFINKVRFDLPLKILLSIITLVPLFHPNLTIAIAGSVVVFVALVIGVKRHKDIGPLKRIQKEAAAAATAMKDKDLKVDGIEKIKTDGLDSV